MWKDGGCSRDARVRAMQTRELTQLPRCLSNIQQRASVPVRSEGITHAAAVTALVRDALGIVDVERILLRTARQSPRDLHTTPPVVTSPFTVLLLLLHPMQPHAAAVHPHTSLAASFTGASSSMLIARDEPSLSTWHRITTITTRAGPSHAHLLSFGFWLFIWTQIDGRAGCAVLRNAPGNPVGGGHPRIPRSAVMQALDCFINNCRLLKYLQGCSGSMAVARLQTAVYAHPLAA